MPLGWAIYVVLHMPHRDDYPYLQATVIREILFQYCETWSAQENQHQFIENLRIPSAWLYEALLSLVRQYMTKLVKIVELSSLL
ncbi:nuclear pore complex protein NUP96-like protein isoform X1 [Tanacetum coccineum]